MSKNGEMEKEEPEARVDSRRAKLISSVVSGVLAAVVGSGVTYAAVPRTGEAPPLAPQVQVPAGVQALVAEHDKAIAAQAKDIQDLQRDHQDLKAKVEAHQKMLVDALVEFRVAINAQSNALESQTRALARLEAQRERR
jgi:hypothetical protein